MNPIDRAHDRIDAVGQLQAVLCHGGEEPPISVMNLSSGGAALMADEPIGQVPERAELRMRFADGSDWVSCPCELRYILGENRPDGEPAWLHGVHFLELPQEAQALIERLAKLQSG